MGKNKWEILLKTGIDDYVDPDPYEISNIINKDIEAIKQEMINNGGDPDEYSDDDFGFEEIELSIIRKDNEGGHKSYGWSGQDKIILTADGIEDIKDLIEWYKKAVVIRDAFNEQKIK